MAAAKELLHRKQPPPALSVPPTPAADAAASGDNAETARRWQQTKEQLASAQADAEQTARHAASVAAAAEAASSAQKLRQELCQAALLESAVFCHPASHGAAAHELHAPARYLAAALCHNDNNKQGGGDLAGLSQRAVDALAAMVLAAGDDLPRAAFWCSNVVALRACLSARLSETQTKGGGAHAGKGSEESEQRLAAAVASLQTLEAAAYHRLLHTAWWRQLVPAMQVGQEES